MDSSGREPWAPLLGLCPGSSPGVLGPQKPREVGEMGVAGRLTLQGLCGGEGVKPMSAEAQACSTLVTSHPAMG